jgi:hypothetical protein
VLLEAGFDLKNELALQNTGPELLKALKALSPKPG